MINSAFTLLESLRRLDKAGDAVNGPNKRILVKGSWVIARLTVGLCKQTNNDMNKANHVGEKDERKPKPNS